MLVTNNKDLKELLKNTKNIAVVGASSKPERESFKVMKYLIKQGYKIFPVNPKEINILGRNCYPSLKSIEEKVDMVEEIFVNIKDAENAIIDRPKIG